jgi:hypothetical protein
MFPAGRTGTWAPAHQLARAPNLGWQDPQELVLRLRRVARSRRSMLSPSGG